MATPVILLPLSWQSPRIRRDRQSAFLYAAALLHEGLQVAQGLGRYFRDFPAYTQGLGRLLGAREVIRLRSEYLKRLRNRGTFHIDLEVFQAGIAHLTSQQHVLVCTARDLRAGSFYFDLADELVLHMVLGVGPDHPQYIERLDDFMTGTSVLNSAFLVASNKLLAAAFKQLGVRRAKPPRHRRPKSAP